MTLPSVTRRSLLTILTAFPLVAGLALTAGCGDNSGGGEAGTTGGAPNTTAASPASGGAPAAGGDKLVVAWAEWEPAKQLEKLAQDFTKETGIAVEVQQIPWSDFENKIKTAWSGQDASFDLIVGDSQWLGKAATAGHYVELTEWTEDAANFPKADVARSALLNYGEYPTGSGKLYAIPCMSDATVFAYRKDLFEDPKEKAAFKAKYKRDLAVPKTWDEFQQVAEFFTRPQNQPGPLYGAALFYSKEYDGVTMGFDQVLWAYGGKLSEGNKATGAINSEAAVKALEFYAGLKKFTPPSSENYYFSECLRDFQQGKVAMAQNWFAFLPDLTNKEKNPHAEHTGYFPVPKGPAGQFISLGGQGLSLSAYSKQQDNAKKFLAWFSKEETQKKWAELGGLTANGKVAATDLFKKATPYNVVFTESVPYLKDFYNTPNYSELLTVTQKELNEAVAGTKKPKEALDTIAAEHDKILASAGN
ncbi:MAG: sugar ABC transporter substrate-binding protein [Capsulimonadales bacterium]|nr:sugar ABC transporter substrate-binding protein [Capsulimonadales bacterium]